MRTSTPLFLILLFVFGALITFLASCKKANREFVGTYTGKSKINGGSDLDDKIVITADTANNSDIYVYDNLENFETLDNCSGNDITVTSQSVPIHGGIQTLTGSGTLTGTTLSLTFYYGTPASSIVFTGTRTGN